MPVKYKLLISVLALLLTFALFWFDRDSEGAARWVALALGPVMVFGIWIFPEAKAREIRKDVAGKR